MSERNIEMEEYINKINKRLNANTSNYKSSAPIISDKMISRLYASKNDIIELKKILLNTNNIIKDNYIEYINKCEEIYGIYDELSNELKGFNDIMDNLSNKTEITDNLENINIISNDWLLNDKNAKFSLMTREYNDIIAVEPLIFEIEKAFYIYFDYKTDTNKCIEISICEIINGDEKNIYTNTYNGQSYFNYDLTESKKYKIYITPSNYNSTKSNGRVYISNVYIRKNVNLNEYEIPKENIYDSKTLKIFKIQNKDIYVNINDEINYIFDEDKGNEISLEGIFDKYEIIIPNNIINKDDFDIKITEDDEDIEAIKFDNGLMIEVFDNVEYDNDTHICRINKLNNSNDYNWETEKIFELKNVELHGSFLLKCNGSSSKCTDRYLYLYFKRKNDDYETSYGSYSVYNNSYNISNSNLNGLFDIEFRLNHYYMYDDEWITIDLSQYNNDKIYNKTFNERKNRNIKIVCDSEDTFDNILFNFYRTEFIKTIIDENNIIRNDGLNVTDDAINFKFKNDLNEKDILTLESFENNDERKKWKIDNTIELEYQKPVMEMFDLSFDDIDKKVDDSEISIEIPDTNSGS